MVVVGICGFPIPLACVGFPVGTEGDGGFSIGMGVVGRVSGTLMEQAHKIKTQITIYRVKR
jgi:hypothetical protein